MSAYQISIVIRCYNEEQHIGRLLSGIMKQTLRNVEIIVVDSGSDDATLSIASRYPVKILSIKSNDFSFGRALNIGCRAANGELIVIASAHVYPIYQDWLEKLLAPFDELNIALTYGKQRGCESTKYSEHQIFATWFPDEPGSILYQNHPFCNNANAAIRRSLWEKISYNETLTGLEDIDWAKRILSLDYGIAYVPQAEVIHVHLETPRRTYNRYRREAIAIKHIYPQEHFHLWDFFRLLIANTISDYYHAWHDGCFMINLLSIPVFRLMQFWGTYRGFTQQALVSNQLRQTFYYPRGLSRSNSSIENSHRETIDYAAQQPFEKIH
jgi:rhamnosyltransferase